MGRRPCCSKDQVNRGAWSLQEDQILVNYINSHGEGHWRDLPQKAGLNRCGKSCRLRWMNYLKPDIKRGDISKDEEDLIIRLHTLLGNRWSLIAGRLPGRTDNEIKNYWNTNLGKRLSTNKKPSPSILTKKKKVKLDQISKNNPNLVQTKPIRLSNRNSFKNQDQGSHHQQIGYKQLAKAMTHDQGRCSSNHTNTTTPSTPEFEPNDDSLGFLMDLDTSNIDFVFEQDQTHAQTNNLDDHFPRNENDQMFNTNDVGDDPSKNLRSLPCSDPLIDGNGIEIKIEDKLDEDQEITCAPSMEINLMLELKKMASFLDVDDEWNNM